MSIFRTIAMFLYLFGYMIVHYGTLRRSSWWTVTSPAGAAAS